jgi:hypothetical protein
VLLCTIVCFSRFSRATGSHPHLDDARPEIGRVMRQESPIIGLKNFNNWIKSVLFANFCHPVLASSPIIQCPRPGPKKGPILRGKVLDMGCGKGGDLNKWTKAHISEYIGLGELHYRRYPIRQSNKPNVAFDRCRLRICRASPTTVRELQRTSF